MLGRADRPTFGRLTVELLKEKISEDESKLIEQEKLARQTTQTINDTEVMHNIVVGEGDGTVDYIPTTMEKNLTRTVNML